MRRLALLLCASAALGCNTPEPTAAASELTASQPSAKARWVEARPPSDRSLLEAPARTVATRAAVAHVAAPFVARVVRLRVAPGDVVRAGDALAEVVMPEVLDAAAVYVATGQRRSLRQARRDQLETLRQEGLVESARVFEQDADVAALDEERARALAVLRAAGVQPNGAGTLLNRGTSILTAPVDGVVASVSVRLGEVREPSGEPLFEIVGTGPVRIEARLPRDIPEGAGLEFVPLAGDRIPLRSDPVASVIDPADGTRRVWLAFAEEKALPDGLRGTLHVRLEGKDVVELPVRAVGRDEHGAFVLRRHGADSERVRVNVLAKGGGSVIVRGALAVGESFAAEVSIGVAEEGG